MSFGICSRKKPRGSATPWITEQVCYSATGPLADRQASREVDAAWLARNSRAP